MLCLYSRYCVRIRRFIQVNLRYSAIPHTGGTSVLYSPRIMMLWQSVVGRYTLYEYIEHILLLYLVLWRYSFDWWRLNIVVCTDMTNWFYIVFGVIINFTFLEFLLDNCEHTYYSFAAILTFFVGEHTCILPWNYSIVGVVVLTWWIVLFFIWNCTRCCYSGGDLVVTPAPLFCYSYWAFCCVAYTHSICYRWHYIGRVYYGEFLGVSILPAYGALHIF